MPWICKKCGRQGDYISGVRVEGTVLIDGCYPCLNEEADSDG